MAQTTQGQAKASRKMANVEMGGLRKNQFANGKVAPALKPNQPVGATKHNQSALNKNKLIEDRFGSSPESVKFG